MSSLKSTNIGNLMEEFRKKFGMELLPSLRKRLKQRAIENDRALYEVHEEAIRNWLGDGQETVVKSPYVAKLEKILDSGDQLAIDGVTANIDFFWDRLRPQPKSPVKVRKTGT